MIRSVFVAVAIALAACGEHDLDLMIPEGAEPGQLQKPLEGMRIDALVRQINGYDSTKAFVDLPRDYEESSIGLSSTCADAKFAFELSPRKVTRARSNGQIRKLVLTWTQETESLFTTVHEAYHYDDTGHLRVVVVDRDLDHSKDLVFTNDVTAHNAGIALAISKLPSDTEDERIAIARMGHELRDAETIEQHRLYFDVSGQTLLFETVRLGVERARLRDYPEIPQGPPTLYSDKFHPGNVTATPYLVALDPIPRYSAQPLSETWVTDPLGSILGDFIAGDPRDPEASLNAPPVCF